MRIGIPKEILHHENRVAANPTTVAKLVEMGFEVVVESGAGAGIHAPDSEYAARGAHIETDVAELFASADLVLKVKQPCFNEALGRHEAELIRAGGMLVTFLHPAAPSSHAMVKVLRDRRVTSFTMDGIPRTTRAQRMDPLTSMSTVTGYRAVLIAASHLPVFVPMMTTAIGMLKPAHFLIVGAGVVGLQSIATAKRLGAVSTCVDIRPEAREEAKSLGARIGGFEVPPELARGAGGYAQALPADWLEKEQALVGELAAEADAVILSALVPGEVAPVLLTAAAVGRMKPGSVVIDVGIDQGGNCAVTRGGEEYFCSGVMVSGVQNIPGSMPVHSTHLYANNVVHYLANLFKKGPGLVDWDDDIVRASLVTHEGRILHAGTLKAMQS